MNRSRLRTVLPWVVSTALLVYVFGWATDWQRMRAATENADLAWFLTFATLDRIAFFVIWTSLSAVALRRFVVHVPVHSVLAIRGGSELGRVVSNHLSDAAFFLGIVRLAGGRLDAVVACMLVPVVSHFLVMLVQMTLALPFLSGGWSDNRDVIGVLGTLWLVVAGLGLGIWLFRTRRVSFPGIESIVAWLEHFPLRRLAPFLWGFAGLAIFDIHIQWLASRAFGVPIDWSALAARLPIVYLTFVIPTLGNFGTRELAWAGLFAEFGARDALIAYAFAINTVFLVVNALLGLIFLPRALELIAAVRRAHKKGEPVPEPILHDPTDA